MPDLSWPTYSEATKLIEAWGAVLRAIGLPGAVLVVLAMFRRELQSMLSRASDAEFGSLLKLRMAKADNLEEAIEHADENRRELTEVTIDVTDPSVDERRVGDPAATSRYKLRRSWQFFNAQLRKVAGVSADDVSVSALDLLAQLNDQHLLGYADTRKLQELVELYTEVVQEQGAIDPLLAEKIDKLFVHSSYMLKHAEENRRSRRARVDE